VRAPAVQRLLGSTLVTASPHPAPQPGDVLAGKYVLRERLGVGGMGIVFLADDPRTSRRVAIKVLHPHLAADEVIARRFREEARAASRVHHRGSVAVLDHGTPPDGAPFIAMELVRGRPLGRLLEEEDLPLPRALGILDQILDALGAVHACGVVHGDVKSDNIMVDAQAGGDAVTLVDFGLAQMDGDVREPGFVAGTPEYLAPELVRGEAPTAAY
jgi:eukaryotic-like serine/threonine-protein kinase